MLILALETATRPGSLALWDDGRVEAAVGDAARTHSVRLPGEILALLAGHGHRPGDIDLFAVVTGPGSFTGLRIGLAAIQGLAMVSGRRVVGVPTLDALIDGWLDEHPGTSGVVAACLDGARGDVFFGAYLTSGSRRVEDARQLTDVRVGSPATCVETLRPHASAGPLVIVGDGAARYSTQLIEGLPDARIEGAMPNLAAAASRLASRRAQEATAPHALRPLYVRRPDAELARDRARRETAPTTAAATAFSIEETVAAGDVASVAALQAASFAHAWGAEAIGSELANLDAARLYVIKTPDGRVVGYCACWEVAAELHINSLGVDPAFRRRGLARRLVTEAIRAAVGRGVAAATLEVRESNAAGRRLYEALGFRVEAVRRNYYDRPSEDGLILWRRDLAAR